MVMVVVGVDVTSVNPLKDERTPAIIPTISDDAANQEETKENEGHPQWTGTTNNTPPGDDKETLSIERREDEKYDYPFGNRMDGKDPQATKREQQQQQEQQHPTSPPLASSDPESDAHQQQENNATLNFSTSSSSSLSDSFPFECFRCCCWPRSDESVVSSRRNRSLLFPVSFCFVATFLSFVGSWGCSYFRGASISFTGGYYGLWTLLDADGYCQLWDVMFFSYTLDPVLHAARFFSMAVQLLGLAILAVLTQALQFHAASWTVGGILGLTFAVSVTLTDGLFNLWIFFFLFTYVIIVLIVRFLFIHPIHRRISQRGTRIIAYVCDFCALSSFLTLIVLRSNFCRCVNITYETLSGREPGAPCDGHCYLDVTGGLFIVAGVLWLVTAFCVRRYGVQPKELKQRRNLGETNSTIHSLYANFPRGSITTRATLAGKSIVSGAQSLGVGTMRTANSFLPRISSFESIHRLEAENSDSNKDEDESNQNMFLDEEKEDSSRSIVNTETNPQSFQQNSAIETESNDKALDSPQDDEPDSRSCCKKCCFDYRVPSRSRKEQCFFWFFRFSIGILIFFYVLIVIFMIGSYIENVDAAREPDTSFNFITDDVCAFNADDPSQLFVTYDSKEEAVLANMTVAHCGACGVCSNPHDIRTYVDTRKTVAILAKQCGSTAVLGTYQELTDCLMGKIGFTLGCTECWSDNLINTAEYCLFTCLKTTLTGLAATNNVIGLGKTVWLNQCIFCDEKQSGPEFVQCSGVARRRLGIVSEIERDPAELCTSSDVDWVNADWSEIFPDSLTIQP